LALTFLAAAASSLAGDATIAASCTKLLEKHARGIITYYKHLIQIKLNRYPPFSWLSTKKKQIHRQIFKNVDIYLNYLVGSDDRCPQK